MRLAAGASPPTTPPGCGGRDAQDKSAPGMDATGELERLARLHDSGALTDEEFAVAKRRVLES
jgi:hypothetical protein